MTDETESKELTTRAPASTAPLTPFASIQGFESAQRVAKALMSSRLVPEVYRNDMGSVLIAMELANRTGSSILAVMQNLNVIHGRPSWSSAYCIAALNQSGRYVEPIHFEFVGAYGKDDWGCYAVGVTKRGTEVKGPTVTVAMAKAEGWYDRKGSKWPTMPELMLRYRAAAFFARTEDPGLLMGMQTQEEVQDVGRVYEPSEPTTASVLDTVQRTDKAPAPVDEEGVIIDVEAEGDTDETEWPKFDGARQTWFDSDGVYYDVSAHAGWAGKPKPETNDDGSFRARRGAVAKARDLAKAAKAEAKERGPQDQGPAPADDGGPASNPVENAPAGPDTGGQGPESDGGQPATSAPGNGSIDARLAATRNMSDLEACESEIDRMEPGKEKAQLGDALGARYRQMKREGLA